MAISYQRVQDSDLVQLLSSKACSACESAKGWEKRSGYDHTMIEWVNILYLSYLIYLHPFANLQIANYWDTGILGFLKYPASLSNLALLLLILRTPSPAIVDKLIFSFRVSELWQYLMFKLQADVANNLLKCS